MSIDAYEAALRTANGPRGTARAIWNLLHWRHNDVTGRCDPSSRSLALACGVHKDAIQRALTALEKNGWITIHRRGRRQSWAYTPHLQPIECPDHPGTHECPDHPGTQCPENTATSARTIRAQLKRTKLNDNPPTPLAGGPRSTGKIPTGTSRTTVHRQLGGPGSTRARSLVEDLTDRSWAE